MYVRIESNQIPIRAISSLHLSEFVFNRVASVYLHKKFLLPDKVLAFLLQRSRSNPGEWLDPTQKKHVALYWKPSFDVLTWLLKVHNLMHVDLSEFNLPMMASPDVGWSILTLWLDWSRVEPHMAGKCTYVRTCMYVCICMYVYVCICMYMYVCTYVCMYMYVCICMYMYVCICMYVCMSVCLYVCMSVCLYVCMFVYCSHPEKHRIHIYIYSQHLLTIAIIVENSIFSLLQEDYMDIARPTR